MTTPKNGPTTQDDFEMLNLAPADLNQGRRRATNRSIRASLMQWLVAHENNKREILSLRRAQPSNAYSEDISGPSSTEVHQMIGDVLGAEEEATYYSNQYLRVLDFFGRKQGLSRNPDESVDHYGERVLGMYHGNNKDEPKRWPYYLTILLLILMLLASLAFLIAGVKRLYSDDNAVNNQDTRGGILFSLSVLMAILISWALAYLLTRYPRRGAYAGCSRGHRGRGGNASAV